MNDIKRYEGNFTVKGNAKFAIVVSRFNSFVVDHLLSGAIDALTRHGVARESIEVVYVPGAFELPLAARRMAKREQCDAIIALGAVIRGGTPHFDYVAGSCVRGLSDIALQCDVPVAMGVLTVDTIEQAIERSGTKAGNKGVEAALTALEMVSLLSSLDAK